MAGTGRDDVVTEDVAGGWATLTIRMPRPMMDELRARATAEGVTVTEYMRRAAMFYGNFAGR